MDGGNARKFIDILDESRKKAIKKREGKSVKEDLEERLSRKEYFKILDLPIEATVGQAHSQFWYLSSYYIPNPDENPELLLLKEQVNSAILGAYLAIKRNPDEARLHDQKIRQEKEDKRNAVIKSIRGGAFQGDRTKSDNKRHLYKIEEILIKNMPTAKKFLKQTSTFFRFRPQILKQIDHQLENFTNSKDLLARYAAVLQIKTLADSALEDPKVDSRNSEAIRSLRKWANFSIKLYEEALGISAQKTSRIYGTEATKPTMRPK
jgi:hypothetical protein